MTDFLKAWWVMVNGPALLVLVLLILIDWIMGIIVALKTHTFKWSYLSNFIKTDVVFQVLGYLLFAFVAVAAPALQPAVYIPWAAIDISLIADIVAKFNQLKTAPGSIP